jgi:leucyl aminopeptidase
VNVVTLAPSAAFDGDLLVIGVGSKLSGLDQADLKVDWDLRSWCDSNAFTGSAGSALLLPGPNGGAKVVALVGYGDQTPIDLAKAASRAGRIARQVGATAVAVRLPGEPDQIAAHVLSGNYDFQKYKPETDRKRAISSLALVGAAAASPSVPTIGAWQSHARDLINAPAADVYPESLAAWAHEHLTTLKGVSVDVWDEAKLTAEGCVGVLAVGQGSTRPPRMIHVQYRTANARGHVSLVGKGVTFDSGGLSMKPSDGMQTMRCDMGGAATVLAAVGAAAELALPINIDVFVAAAENMVDGNSFKLGDVLTYANGVSVEIHNTDAEGRLVLADALIHACRVKESTHLIDVATLTGACVIALGGDFTGLFTASDDLANELTSAAALADEGLWRLPLHQDYKALLKGTWGQIKNVGGREAGSTTAALFLQHFVDGPTWAHLDIAGSSFHDKACNRYGAGATGQPVLTLVHWLKGRCA